MRFTPYIYKMSFLLLPLEIKNEIISQIPSIDDLAALSQSCRSMHQLCDVKRRKQFHRIRVSGKDAFINQTFDILMEILKKPSLGNYVREIQQQRRPSPGAPYIGRDEQRKLSEGDMNLIREAVKRAGFSGTQESAVINMLMQNTSKAGSEDGNPFGERSLGGHGYR